MVDFIVKYQSEWSLITYLSTYTFQVVGSGESLRVNVNTMSNLGLNIAIHASGVALFGYSLFYDFFYVHYPPEVASTEKFKALSSWPGKWKFLTIWNLVWTGIKIKIYIPLNKNIYCLAMMNDDDYCW